MKREREREREREGYGVGRSLGGIATVRADERRIVEPTALHELSLRRRKSYNNELHRKMKTA